MYQRRSHPWDEEIDYESDDLLALLGDPPGLDSVIDCDGERIAYGRWLPSGLYWCVEPIAVRRLIARRDNG